ncbi:glutathione S-transferase 1-like [Cydia strobilella]|uniref:glutathione S-transferase 1-like n=1 Tax=Cydia strobilella TaxID=1100964 RepID=UPI00300519C8
MRTILYHSNSSPPSRAVKMVAGILNVEYEERYLNPVARDQDTPELIEKNPMRSIPLLDEGDYWIADSHAIIVYLFEKYAKPEHQHLYPSDIRKRATINQRMYFECGILFPRLRSVMAPTFRGKLTDLSKSMKSNIEDAYRTLQAYLSRTLYVADDVLTLADISIVTTVSTLDGIYPVDVKRYPKLKEWLLTMSQKDFCQKYNEPGREELVTLLVTMMRNNQHNQRAKL